MSNTTWTPWLDATNLLWEGLTLRVRAETATYPHGGSFIRYNLEVSQAFNEEGHPGHPFALVEDAADRTELGEIVRDRPLQRALLNYLAMDNEAFEDATSHNRVTPELVRLLGMLWD